MSVDEGSFARQNSPKTNLQRSLHAGVGGITHAKTWGLPKDEYFPKPCNKVLAIGLSGAGPYS